MRRVFVLVLALMMCVSALALDLEEAAEVERLFTGKWANVQNEFDGFQYLDSDTRAFRLLFDGDGSIHLYNILIEMDLLEYRGEVQISPDGRYMTLTKDGVIKIYERQ